MAHTPGQQQDPADEFGKLLASPPDDGDEPPRHGRERRKRRRIWPWAIGMLLVIVLAVAGAGWFAYTTYPDQVKALFGWSNDYSGPGEGSVRVEIRPGDYGQDVAATLVQQGVTKTQAAFYDLLLKTKPEPSLQPGTYDLRHHMSAEAALKALQDPANRVESTVAIPEGSTSKQILQIAAGATGVPLADLKAAAKDYEQFGIPKSAPNIEGWLFPATYTFQPDTSAKAMLQAMVDRMKQALDEAGVAPKDREKTLILAGLVQKESNGVDDAKVARVFLNRIKEGMPLQSDATVSYGAGGTTVVPTPAEKADKNGYNTYLRNGLPIGPISSPGDVAIKAAVSPAKGKWLYFVTVNLETGETKFATTYAQHQKNADEFLKWLAAHPSYAK
ncbi:endolytic transglycosylase MltG [Amnibacterium endophyticum]|uniref:Endolytic murein transglycosylase n=1 Tax=Amnibacterium endophyticum TaxID=2109337 RepID=A0ABW4LC87_9MICO